MFFQAPANVPGYDVFSDPNMPWNQSKPWGWFSQPYFVPGETGGVQSPLQEGWQALVGGQAALPGQQLQLGAANRLPRGGGPNLAGLFGGMPNIPTGGPFPVGPWGGGPNVPPGAGGYNQLLQQAGQQPQTPAQPPGDTPDMLKVLDYLTQYNQFAERNDGVAPITVKQAVEHLQQDPKQRAYNRVLLGALHAPFSGGS